ncbi:MAG: SGNH/GDSL hydrolase family protein, partial [Planctomycetota bacterium]|nr:SGNH/GDSL hydrolase family protein [Planctomycetota bacterium]
PETGLHWYDSRAFGIEGQGWSDTQRTYARYPAKAEGVVRDPVWELAQHSAGLCVRFVTSARAISARWQLWNENLAMAHMPATGVSGLDLYIKDPSRPRGRQYHWIGFGTPDRFPDNEAELVGGLGGEAHEFILYLPLYNGVERVEIGIDEESTIDKAPARTTKPIVMYGTSILHGGCASRPGMSYPAIIGRAIDQPIINLGFSGNGQAEPEVAELLTELDPSVYVLDYCPNVGPAQIRERTEPFVEILRNAHPETPIVLVENITYQKHLYVESARSGTEEKNAELRAAFDRLREAGVKHLLYVPGDKLLGDDGEGTVDGVHPTDVGFMRMAETVGPVVEALL